MRIDDGFSTLVTIGVGSSAAFFWEKGVTPPGVEGGGENDTTTMHNTNWRTKSPKKLKTMSPMTLRVAYDPEIYDKIVNLINVNQQIVITWADGSKLTFWGWVDSFKPGEIVEGAQPEADCTIIPSNQDNSGNEVSPQYSNS